MQVKGTNHKGTGENNEYSGVGPSWTVLQGRGNENNNAIIKIWFSKQGCSSTHYYKQWPVPALCAGCSFQEKEEKSYFCAQNMFSFFYFPSFAVLQKECKSPFFLLNNSIVCCYCDNIAPVEKLCLLLEARFKCHSLGTLWSLVNTQCFVFLSRVLAWKHHRGRAQTSQRHSVLSTTWESILLSQSVSA